MFGGAAICYDRAGSYERESFSGALRVPNDPCFLVGIDNTQAFSLDDGLLSNTFVAVFSLRGNGLSARTENIWIFRDLFCNAPVVTDD